MFYRFPTALSAIGHLAFIITLSGERKSMKKLAEIQKHCSMVLSTPKSFALERQSSVALVHQIVSFGGGGSALLCPPRFDWRQIMGLHWTQPPILNQLLRFVFLKFLNL